MPSPFFIEGDYQISRAGLSGNLHSECFEHPIVAAKTKRLYSFLTFIFHRRAPFAPRAQGHKEGQNFLRNWEIISGRTVGDRGLSEGLF